MTSSIKVALALTLLLAAPSAATAATDDQYYGARLRAEIRREIRESVRGVHRLHLDARRATLRAMAYERWRTRDIYRHVVRDSVRDAQRAARNSARDAQRAARNSARDARRATRDTYRRFWRD
jgi:hypothetical protein